MKRFLLFISLCFVTLNLSAQNSVAAVDSDKGLGRDGVYQVGDYYNRDGKQGVVFEVDATGRHGKIVSLHKSAQPLGWSTFKGYHDNLHGPIGETSESDGTFNLAQVKKLFKEWDKKYPAFQWCVALGEGWYLPAKDELTMIIDNKEVTPKVEQTLKKYGTPLFGDNKSQYWSSTQHSKYQAFSWYNDNGGNWVILHKYYELYVRAVAKF